jgi:hypothetical protein
MSLYLDYPAILQNFPQHLDPHRTESASFLIWYLEKYYRLDELEAVDSVCDQPGDRGVDGIYINDNDMTITVFQSRILQRSDRTIGDSTLREFAGTLKQFESREAVESLIEGAGDAQVAHLARRLDVASKVETHEIQGEFLTNVELDGNGSSFLSSEPQIGFVGRIKLLDTYISDARALPMQKRVQFDVLGLDVSTYRVDDSVDVVIAPVKATELVGLDGIADQSLFAFNVRGPLGRTKVNRDIVRSVRDASTHKLFPLFHNGITIIVQELDVRDDVIQVQDYRVVNGCQSLNALHENTGSLTDGLRILTKFIRMDPASDLAATVTKISNNQNAVKSRDFMANNPIQIRLQNEFATRYSGAYSLEIKRGESPNNGTVIANETAGLYLQAFDLKEPWATHRKYQVFADKYTELFARPEVTADRIVLCQTIVEAIEQALPDIKNTLLAKYVLTKYLVLYVVRLMLEEDEIGLESIRSPERFVHDEGDRKHFKECVTRVVKDIIIDLNAEVAGLGEDFDYRGRLRDSEWVQQLSRKLVADQLKLVQRGRVPSLAQEWRGLQDE